jgi:hypothetical protein
VGRKGGDGLAGGVERSRGLRGRHTSWLGQDRRFLPAAARQAFLSACDDRLVATAVFSISANTIEQFPLGAPPGCEAFGQVSDGPTYVRVTIDQEGFAVAAVRADGIDATIPATITGDGDVGTVLD